MTDIHEAHAMLASFGQEHLLAFTDQLDQSQKENLLAQIDKIDFEQLSELIQSHVLGDPPVRKLDNLLPPEIFPAEPQDDQTAKLYAKATELGKSILSEGRAAAFTVAGGQGTRLGYDGPKGCFEVTPVKNKSLFQVFAEQILATSKRYGKPLAWCIMTSQINDAATRDFFEKNNYFGLSRDDVRFFSQSMMPAVSLDGKVLLADKGNMALSPNGHGGSLSALSESGVLAWLAERGVDYISYCQVDNPMVKVFDPLFLGLHELENSDMSSKALPKREPLEKLGNFCVLDGKVTIIEYSDLPDEYAYQTESDGRLKFRAGSIAIHVISRKFIEKINAGGRCALPLHKALKKVPYLAADGRYIAPDEPNAIKLEMFVFDALDLVDSTMILETSRVDEFSPVKNASGSDSLSTCLADQTRRSAQWLESAGVSVPRDADGIVAAAVEISPLYALDAEQLAEKIDKNMEIEPGSKIYLGD